MQNDNKQSLSVHRGLGSGEKSGHLFWWYSILNPPSGCPSPPLGIHLHIGSYNRSEPPAFLAELQEINQSLSRNHTEFSSRTLSFWYSRRALGLPSSFSDWLRLAQPKFWSWDFPVISSCFALWCPMPPRTTRLQVIMVSQSKCARSSVEKFQSNCNFFNKIMLICVRQQQSRNDSIISNKSTYLQVFFFLLHAQSVCRFLDTWVSGFIIRSRLHSQVMVTYYSHACSWPWAELPSAWSSG